MPKLKTRKSVLKRVSLNKKSVSRRTIKQNHCLSKLTGQKKQKKRKKLSFSKGDLKKINLNLPYSK